MNNIQVIKRNGEVVPFDVLKIRNIIKSSCEGLRVDPMELESNLQVEFKKKMTSVEIHEAIIQAAFKLVTPQSTDWAKVAGRLRTVALYKEASITRGYKTFGYHSYKVFVEKSVQKGIYDKVILEKYSTDEINELGKHINPDYDLELDYANITQAMRKYLFKDEYGRAYELPQEMFMTIALLNEQDAPETERLSRVLALYSVLGIKSLSCATPILRNLRKPKGNLSSCFIAAMDDSLDSIQYVETQVGKISQAGGGVGVNVSRIRSKGASIQNAMGASKGVLPWARSLNTKVVNVNQLGTRPGACTVSLDIWHRDVYDFLELQTEQGDMRTKAFDIFPQLVVLDEFMERKEKDKSWYMFDPKEILDKYGYDFPSLYGEEFSKAYNHVVDDVKEHMRKVKIKIKSTYDEDFAKEWRDSLSFEEKKRLPVLVDRTLAKNLWATILGTNCETGMPFYAYKCTINRFNPNKDSGYIPAGNLCMESFSNTSPTTDIFQYGQLDKSHTQATMGDVHTCNLCSVNLAVIEDDKQLEEVCTLAVRSLDNLIDQTTAPIPESFVHNTKYRTIGVGVMGYADYAAKRGVTYEASEELADELFEKFAYYCTRASIDLAKEKGTFGDYKNSEYKKGIILGRNEQWFKENARLDWSEIFKDLKKYGIRNSQITAIAPTSSTSVFMGATPSVLPIYKKLYVDSSSINVPVYPPYVQDHFWTYKENRNIDQKKVIDVCSKVQKWIDTGISMELNFNLDNPDYSKASYLDEVMTRAWKKECKTIYYIRWSESKGGGVCDSCEN